MESSVIQRINKIIDEKEISIIVKLVIAHPELHKAIGEYAIEQCTILNKAYRDDYSSYSQYLYTRYCTLILFSNSLTKIKKFSRGTDFDAEIISLIQK